MHRTRASITVILFLLSLTSFAKKNEVEKSKQVNKSFTVTKDQIIELDNKFGKLNITSWDKDVVEVDIHIKVSGNSEKKVQEKLDKINIKISNTSKVLSVKTSFGDEGKKNYNSESGIEGSINIDYKIKVPSKNKLKAENSFGPFFLDQLDADAKIKVSFGSATIGKLKGETNLLKFQFSDPIIITELTKGKIDLQHSKLELARVKQLTLESEMSSSQIEKVDSGDIDLKFGSSEIDEIITLKLNSQMSSVKINKMHGKGIIETSYGSFTVSHLMKGATQLTVDGEFSPIKVNLDKNNSYSVNARSKMGGLKVPKGSVNESKEEKNKYYNDEKSFKGSLGNKSGKNTPITIQSSFGEVKLTLAD